MLTLPIKKKWFDMILSGEKKEEYREINPYYNERFQNLFGMVWIGDNFVSCNTIGLDECAKDNIQEICFRNGYSSKSSSFIAKCGIEVGEGKPEWGAEPNKNYYVLLIHEVLTQDT